MHHLGIIWSAMTVIPNGQNLLTRDRYHQVFHGKPQIANPKMSSDHGLAVAFAVCSSRLTGTGKASSGN